MLLTLAGCWFALSVMTQPLPAKAKATTAAQARAADKAQFLPVEGTWQTTEQDAWMSAQTQAQLALVDHYRQQGLMLARAPSVPELRQFLANYWQYQTETKDFPDGVGRMHRVVLEIPLNTKVRSYFVDQDRQQRTQERMMGLGKILAGVVVLLVAASGYFRLDEWTKGYYTTWLRFGTAGFIGASILLLLLLA
jgi:hypothetical protein